MWLPTDLAKSSKVLNTFNLPPTTWQSWLPMTGHSYIANLALMGSVVTLTVANKKLADVLAKAKGVTTPAVMSGPGAGHSTNTPFLVNYCWLLDPWPLDQPACDNKVLGLKDSATAANTICGSKNDKGWSTCTSWCGMANSVHCDDNDLCKNNYYYALSTSSASNSPKTNLPEIPHRHHQLWRQCQWLLLYHQCTSCQLQPRHSCCQHPHGYWPPRTLCGQCHPCLGHRPASCRDAGTCHALMPPFPCQLGVICRSRCKIFFDKTLVTVYHTNSHPILAG